MNDVLVVRTSYLVAFQNHVDQVGLFMVVIDNL